MFTSFVSGSHVSFLSHFGGRRLRFCGRRPKTALLPLSSTRTFGVPRLTPTKSCIESPAWKRGPIDVDFEKDEQLQVLEEELDVALEAEDFSSASKIRDKLLRLQSGSYVAVLSANMKFYQAFDNGSIVDMAGCWLQDSATTCKHPLGPLVVGYLDILNSFGYLFALGIPSVQTRNVRILMRGSVAIVTCEEHSLPRDQDSTTGPTTKFKDVSKRKLESDSPVIMLATNIFVKRNGQWYVTHHTSNPLLSEVN